MKTVTWLFYLCFCSQILFGAEKQNLFRYDASQPLNVEEKSGESHGDIMVHDIRFTDVAGQTMSAYLITPKGKGPYPAILYVHWLGDPETSNRKQFLKEAEDISQHGAITLLVDMPWAVQGWFRNRNLRDDYDFSIRQVQNLQRSIDLLAQRSDVDRKRIAYVGHDFGATYGAILLGTDTRIRYAVLMAGTPILSDWLLLGSQIQGEEREAYVKKMAPLDPVNFIGKAKSVPLLLQFATQDKFISKGKVELFSNSASEPNELRWYEAEHELSEQAAAERVTWLEAQLKITTTSAGN